MSPSCSSSTPKLEALTAYLPVVRILEGIPRTGEVTLFSEGAPEFGGLRRAQDGRSDRGYGRGVAIDGARHPVPPASIPRHVPGDVLADKSA